MHAVYAAIERMAATRAQEGRMKLYEVNVSGAAYWILGLTGAPAEMQAAIEQAEGMPFAAEHWDPLVPNDIREVSEKEAREPPCGCEDGPPTDMWTAAQSVRGEQPAACRDHGVQTCGSCPYRECGDNSDSAGYVVACSEWP